MSQITPHAIANIGWKTFLMFAIFNYAIIFYSWFVLRETAHKSLEEMEVVFGTVDRLPTAKNLEDGDRAKSPEVEREEVAAGPK
jgi:hypothetical protein